MTNTKELIIFWRSHASLIKSKIEKGGLSTEEQLKQEVKISLLNRCAIQLECALQEDNVV